MTTTEQNSDEGRFSRFTTDELLFMSPRLYQLRTIGMSPTQRTLVTEIKEEIGRRNKRKRSQKSKKSKS